MAMRASRSRARSPSDAVLPLAQGAQIAIGARRLHVLPTPLSSFLACGATEADAAALAREPLLESLSTRMKTRVGSARHRWAQGPAMPAPFAGVAAIAGGDGAAATVEWLLRHGAAEVLVLPRNAPSPTRVSSSTGPMKPLAAPRSPWRPACCATFPPKRCIWASCPKSRPGAQRPAPMRALLDARSEAQQTHGLEMRTELAIGETVTELTRNLSAGGAPMLVLGITDITQAGSAYRSLLAAQPGWPVLIVYRPAETRAAPDLVASGTAA